MKKYILIIISGLMMVSCADSFLNRYPEGEWHEGNYPETETNYELLAKGKLQEAYGQLRNYSFVSSFIALHNMTTPVALKGSIPSDGTNYDPFTNMSYMSDNAHIKNYYQNAYSTIEAANTAITFAATLPDSLEVSKNSIVAQAVVLRATMYFRLTQAFGAVPYIDKVVGQDEKTIPRTPVEEINSKIIADLEWSIPYLTTRKELVKKGDYGVVTQNSARAILAKIALYQRDWSETLRWTNEIIQSGDNDLSTPYSLIFTEPYVYCPESVYTIFCDEKPALNIYMGSQYSQIQGIRGVPNLGWGFNVPSNDLINSYEKGDPRKDATIILDGEILDGVKVVAQNNMPQKTFNKKVYPPASERGVYGRPKDGQGQWISIRLIRYSDILLMNAEAAYHQGNMTEALAKINQVRERARGGDANVLPNITDTNPDAVMEAIRKERLSELAMEFEHFFDLVRWGIASEVIPGFIVGKNELFPIPQIEIDKSDGIITQNPGY